MSLFGTAPTSAPASNATSGGFNFSAQSSGLSFGTSPAPAPSTGTGFSFGQSPATGAPAPTSASGLSFGTASAGAPAPPFGLGNFGSSASAPAPASGFSFGSATAPPAQAPTSTFGAWGTSTPAPAAVAPTATFGLSGTAASAPASTGFSFGGLGGAPPATGGSLFGGKLFDGVTGNVPATPPAPQIQPDTYYKNLPPGIKSVVDGLWKEMDKQHKIVEQLERVDMSSLLELERGIPRLRRGTLTVENVQGVAHVALKEVKDASKQSLRDAEKHGHWSLQQLSTPQMVRMVERLPSPFLWVALQRFEARLQTFLVELCKLESVFMEPNTQKSKGQQGAFVPYGQRYKLSPEQLAAILKEQHAAFMRVAGHVSIAHEWLEDTKDRCSDATGSDPFTAADKAREVEEFRLTKQLSHKYSTGQTPQTQPSNRNKQALDQVPSQWATTIPSAPGTSGGGDGSAAAPRTASVLLSGTGPSAAETSSTSLSKKSKNRSKKGSKTQIYS